MSIRPTLNKKLFLVHHPNGLKRADWNFFFNDFLKTSFSFSILSVLSSSLKMENKKTKQKRPPDWPIFSPPGGQETIYHLRVA